MEIRIDSSVELYVKIQHIGELEITNKEVRYSRDEDDVMFCIEFSNSKGIIKWFDISLPIIEAEEHLNRQLASAEEQAKKYNRRLDRYIVKEMWVQKIFFTEKGVYLEFCWKDVFGDERVYRGREYNLRTSSMSDSYFAELYHPQFYF